MTEIADKDNKISDIEILTTLAKFGDMEIQLICDEIGEVYIPIENVGRAVNYRRPVRDVEYIMKSHAEAFKDKIRDFPLSPMGTPIRALNRKGLDLFLFFSGQPKAIDFKLWFIVTCSHGEF